MFAIVTITVVMLAYIFDTNLWACPSCSASGNSKYFTQILWALWGLWLTAAAMFGFIFWRIKVIQNNEK